LLRRHGRRIRGVGLCLQNSKAAEEDEGKRLGDANVQLLIPVWLIEQIRGRLQEIRKNAVWTFRLP
jgi:hypothetical protein